MAQCADEAKFLLMRFVYDEEKGCILYRENGPHGVRAGHPVPIKTRGDMHFISFRRRRWFPAKIAVAIKTGKVPDGFVRVEDGNPLNLRWSNISVSDEWTPWRPADLAKAT